MGVTQAHLIKLSLAFTLIFQTLNARPLLSNAPASIRIDSINTTATTLGIIAPFGISYFGGRLLTTPITVNFIIYGTKWPKDVANYTAGFKDFVNSIKFTAGAATVPDIKKWWSISATYVDAKKFPVSADVSVGVTIFDPSSQGLVGLTDLSLQAIVKNAFVKNLIKPSSTAINVVVTDSSITLNNGFCKIGCGSHGSFAYTTFDILYAHVGNPEIQCSAACMPQFQFPQRGIYWQPPNKIAALDAMINVLAHEMATIANDPNPNRLPIAKPGYYDGTTGPYRGYESADFCTYDYGIVQLIPVTRTPLLKSIAFNMLGINKRQFLIQTNYHMVKKLCVMF